MKREKSIRSKIISLIFLIILIGAFIKVCIFYKSNFYNDFIKVVTSDGITNFTRDDKIKFSEERSYKLESDSFNDAMFYKEIEVKPNTPYRVTCMVKTENVETEKEISGSGAQICIADTTECSESYVGDNEWKELEFMFNSKNRSSVKIGFRLGGNADNVKGTAWFSDFKLEEGRPDTLNTNWNMACFIFENIDVVLDGKRVEIGMNKKDIETMKSDMERFKNACNELSGERMTVTYDIFEIEEPITSISYSDEYGYYVDPVNIKDFLKKYIEDSEYDHIFVVVRLGDEATGSEIIVNDWIGLRKYGLYWNWIF